MIELLGSVDPGGWACSALCGAGCGAACVAGCGGACAADGPIPILDAAVWKLAIARGAGGLSTARGFVMHW